MNGHEVGRVNLPAEGRLDYNANPTSAGAVNRQLLLDSVALNVLRPGDNVVSIEVHVPETASVPSFDAYVIDQTMARVVPFGAQWAYSDKGYRPPDKTLGEILSGIADEPSVPVAMALLPNYPNPFNPQTRITYSVSKAGNVALEVFDMLGRRVAVLLDEYRPAGTYTTTFDAGHMASGAYILRMRAAGFQSTQKMLLLR